MGYGHCKYIHICEFWNAKNADSYFSCIVDKTFEGSGLLAVQCIEGAAMSADTIKSEKSIQLLFFLGHQVSHIVVMGAQHSTKE